MRIHIAPCPKGDAQDLDKTRPPAQTIADVRRAFQAMEDAGLDVLAETRRIDTGRLDVPVYLSVCGGAARRVMPTRKQMGKGASPEQAEASALMELVERFSLFSFWEETTFRQWTWSQAEAHAAAEELPPVMPLAHILRSVGEEGVLDEAQARALMDTRAWWFHPATDLSTGEARLVPLDWFKILGEFNGCCAGNAPEESLLQGGCELVERHVCALWTRERMVTPSIDPTSLQDPVLVTLLEKFTHLGIEVALKDFSMGMPVPTVAAACLDPTTYPERSEIVFTAGTAATPAKAAIRALTEVAQLAGDFETAAVYEASGLPKLDEAEFRQLLTGPMVPLADLPTVEADDFAVELTRLAEGLAAQDAPLYAVDVTHSRLGLPSHYCFAPGLQFRERDEHASMGLFVGRLLAEQAEDPEDAEAGLEVVRQAYAHAQTGGEPFFLPFFRGMLALRQGQLLAAEAHFAEAEPLQPSDEKRAMTAFYQGYTLTLLEDWRGSIPCLDRAIALAQDVKEYFNLRGVAKFKQSIYDEAACDFETALTLDKGSATDLANLGVCKRRLGERNKAMELLSAALELDPRLEYARAQLEELAAGKP